MPSPDNSSARSLTDNWLMQNAAELLERSIDPDTLCEYPHFNEGGLQRHTVCVGAVQVICLCSLIEQVILSDKLCVMGTWTNAWEGISSQIDVLPCIGLIEPFNSDDNSIRLLQEQYTAHLCEIPEVANEHKVSWTAWQKGEANVSAQIIGGSAGYLAYADHGGTVYYPHPLRARFLDKVLYKRSMGSSPSRSRLNYLVNTSRVKLAESVGIRSVVRALNCSIGSIAMHCLRESSDQSLPILTAIQMRESEEFRSLRSTLWAWDRELSAHGQAATARTHAKQIEDAVRDVERTLKLRKLDEDDGISQVNYVGLPIKVPEFLRRPIFRPKHTSAMLKLVCAISGDMEGVFRKSLGLTSSRIIEQLIRFSTPHSG